MSEEFRLYESHELGPDGYPAEWHATIKHAVRAEAGNRCVRCGHPYTAGVHGKGEWTPCDELCHHQGPLRWSDGPGEAISDHVQAQWRILTVHHLDHNKANCRWWNLASLCQRCHLTIQGKVYPKREYVREHSEWFKPYAAGWYAFRYLNEDLTREEVAARLDELLDLEFRQPRLDGIA